MLAMVVSPSSGDTFAIRPQHWAREIALTWLEQGECLLNEDFVYPLPLFLALRAGFRAGRGERATIFVSEHDFQRLMAKQEVKQEAVPSDPIADVEAREKDKGGRPPDYDWEQVKDYALILVQKHGKPGKGNRRLPSKDQLADAILDEWASKDIHLAKSTVSRYLRKWLREI